MANTRVLKEAMYETDAKNKRAELSGIVVEINRNLRDIKEMEITFIQSEI